MAGDPLEIKNVCLRWRRRVDRSLPVCLAAMFCVVLYLTDMDLPSALLLRGG